MNPAEWHGDHFAENSPGHVLLVLWSLVQDDDSFGFCVHRATLRSNGKEGIEICFDSPALKSKKRQWQALVGAHLFAMPPEHKQAIANWSRGIL